MKKKIVQRKFIQHLKNVEDNIHKKAKGLFPLVSSYVYKMEEQIIYGEKSPSQYITFKVIKKTRHFLTFFLKTPSDFICFVQ